MEGKDIDFLGKLASEATDDCGPTNDNGQSPLVIPPDFVSKRAARDGDHWHMTILNIQEISDLVKKAIADDESAAKFRAMLDEHGPRDNIIDTNGKTGKKLRKAFRSKILQFCEFFLRDRMTRKKDWFVLGVGKQTETCAKGKDGNECFFLVCSFPRADALRKKLNLPSKDFHITLGFKTKDIHNCSKGVEQLLINQPRSLVASLDPVVTTPNDLVEATNIAILEGQADEKVKNETFLSNDPEKVP